uniref:DDE Tnp4 domain-containing protein n=1 Tax=Heliothis virescens TaxID=7102 RepID=A0A2A4K981_HELVI
MDVEVVAAAALYLCATYDYYLAVHRRHAVPKRRIRRRRCWMQAIHQERTRLTLNDRLEELQTGLTGQYFVHMSATDFEYLIQKISPIIKKQDTYFRDSIPAKIRIAVTLRFLATGDSYTTLHRFFKISSSLVSRIIPEVCIAFIAVLEGLIRMPSIPEEWLTKSKGFTFPYCVGALDGKHIPIWSPSHTGPQDMNYQGNYSMALLSLVDSDYSFMYANVSQSQNTDYKLFNESNLWLDISAENLNLPPDSNRLPYVFSSDGVFPLDRRIMKPVPGNHVSGSPESIFNQMLAQSHSVVDNAFGLLSAVFKVLLKPMLLEPAKCSLVIRSCLLLHNFLIKSDMSRDIYCPPGSVDTYIDGVLVSQGAWRLENQDHFQPLQTLPCSPDADAIQVRLNFLDYVYRHAQPHVS